MSKRYSVQPQASMMPGFIFHGLRAVEALAQTCEIIAVTARDLTDHGAAVIELNLLRMQADLVAQMAEAGHSIPDEYKHLVKG